MDTVDNQDIDSTGITRSYDDDDYKIKGAAARAKKSGKQKEAPAEHCVICLQPITDRAVAVPCNHLAFDFVCLVSWLQHRETCPLCQIVITELQYDWHDADEYQTYHLEPSRLKGAEEHGQPQARGHLDRGSLRRHLRGEPGGPAPANSVRDQDFIPREDAALAQRRRVYRERLYSLHVGANSVSQYRDFTPHDFANSVSLQTRARMFLRRELKLFSYLDAEAGVRNREFVLEYIVAVLKQCDVKAADGRAEDLLSEFLERGNARLLLHELHSWLRGPFERLEEWDRNVQYSPSASQAMQTKGISNG